MTPEQVEEVAASVEAAWCKPDASVRESRCRQAAKTIRHLAALSVAQGQGWRLMGRMTIDGAVWSGPNPHDRDANPPGTLYYAAPAQPDGVGRG